MTIETAVGIESCPAGLSDQQVARFHEEGYLAFENLLTADEVGEIKQAMFDFVRDLHQQAIRGEAEITRGNWQRMRNYSGISIASKEHGCGVLLEPNVEMDVTKATAREIDCTYRKLFNYTDHNPVFRRMAEHPRLRRLVSDLIGPDPILKGDMALSKPPRIGVSKPWHQDMAYFNYLPLDGGAHAWIAVDDATVENGCMIVLPGGHKLGPKMHVHLEDCTIDEGCVDYAGAVPVELRAGGVLIFSPMLPHETKQNLSDERRRALQYFFRGAHTQILSREEYDRHFLDPDGMAATCHAAGQRRKRG